MYKLYQCKYDAYGHFLPVYDSIRIYSYIQDVHEQLNSRGRVSEIIDTNPMFEAFLAPAGKDIKVYMCNTDVNISYWICISE